ncbi:MAG: hypothetical protein NZ822_03255 [Patescibacteria group bacterium]|nr:hypothetical protein [Patescibacteria group bacterium]
MKIEIIPSINVQTFEELQKRIKLLENLTFHFHLDIAEAEFTNGYQTWLDANYLDLLDEKLILDLHLMIYFKPQEIWKWLKRQVKAVAIHLDSSPNPDAVIRIIKRSKKSVFICWPPDFEFKFIEKYINYIDGILVLGVMPGSSGQIFIEETYNRLDFLNNLRNRKKSLKLMIDGGINLGNINKIALYKPNYIIIGSEIYNSNDPQEMFIKIRDSLK